MTNLNLTKEYNCMKKKTMLKILLVITLILTLFSFIFHKNMTLIIPTILMTVCITISSVKTDIIKKRIFDRMIKQNRL